MSTEKGGGGGGGDDDDAQTGRDLCALSMNRNKLSVGELNGRNGYGQLFSWPDALVSKCMHFLEIWSAILVIGIG